MAVEDLTLKLLLDTGPAEEKLGEVADKADKAFGGGAGRLQSMAKAAAVAAGAVGGIVVAFQALEKVLQLAQDRFDLLGRARIWQVQADNARGYRDILNDVRSSAEALADVVELRQLGFTEEDITRAARYANIIAAATGEEKDSVLARVRRAQITERDLGVINKIAHTNKSILDIQNAITKASIAHGGATLTVAQRSRAVMQALLGSAENARKLEAKLGDVGKANPFTVFKKDIKSLSDDARDVLAPALLKVFNAAKAGFQGLGKFVAAIFVTIKEGPRAAAKIFADMQRASELLAKSTQRKITAATKKEIKKRTAAQIAAEQAVARRAIARQEALSEIKGRLSRARSLVRNFQREALTSLAGFGIRGLSQTIGSIARIDELSKVLGRNITGSGKGAQLMRLELQKGDFAAKKLLATFADQRDMVAASLATSKEERATIQGRVKARQLELTLAASREIVKRAILIVAQRQDKLAQSQIKKLRGIFFALKKQRDLQREQVKIAVARGREEDRIAKIKASFSKVAAGLQQEKKLLDLAHQRKALQDKIAQASGRRVQNAGAAAAAAASATSIEIRAIQALIEQNRQLALATSDPKKKTALQAQAAAQMQIMDGLKQRMALEIQLSDTMKKQTDLAKLQAQQQDAWLKQRVATTTSLAQGMTQTIGQLFSDVLTAPQDALASLGANILSAFGDLAFKLAAFFAAQGVALLWTIGGAANGIGLLAAAAGLAAVGGLLKGAGSLVAPSAAKPSSGATSTGSGSTSSPSQGLPGSRATRNQQPTQTIIFVGDPALTFGDEQQKARWMRNFMNRNKRALGATGR